MLLSGSSCLRSLPVEELAATANETHRPGYAGRLYGYGDIFNGPVVDGTIIRGLPSKEFKLGHFAKVSLLTDREGYEGYVFSNQGETNMSQEKADLEQLLPYAKKSFFGRLSELHPRSSFNTTFFQQQSIFGDFIVSFPT